MSLPRSRGMHSYRGPDIPYIQGLPNDCSRRALVCTARDGPVTVVLAEMAAKQLREHPIPIISGLEMR